MIRAATSADVLRLVELGAAMHAESRYARLGYSPQKVERMLGMVLERGFLYVVESDSVVVGGFAGIVEEHWFSGDKIGTDLALFVEPGRRGGFAAAALVRAFIAWARERGAVMTDILINTGVRVDETAALFDRLGGQRTGLVYTWEGE